MSRIREDYEKTVWRRLVHFINGDEKDITEEAGYEVETEATAQRIHEGIFSPEGSIAVPQDHICVLCIHIQHHAHRLRHSGANPFHQFLLLR